MSDKAEKGSIAESQAIYKAITGKSHNTPVSIKTWDEVKVLLAESKTLAVAWTITGVKYYDNSTQAVWDSEVLDHVDRLRVFNENMEIFIFRVQGGWKGRMREDGKGKDACWVEAGQILNGENFKNTERGMQMTSKEGVTFILSFANTSERDIKRMKIITRNYIDYNSMGQAGFVDSRFVKFEQVYS